MRGYYWTPQQRQKLEAQVSRIRDAALYRRIWALLEVDDGRPIAQVAQQLRVDRRSIYRWMARFAAEPTVEALAQQPGQGRPAHWNSDMADLVKRALGEPPFRFGYLANSWTVPLLRAFLIASLPGTKISCDTVRRGLKAMDYAWKRYRYVLLPDPEEEKKTPYSGPNPGFTERHSLIGSGRNGSAALPFLASGLGTSGASGYGADYWL